MENPIDPKEQQAMREWRASQQEKSTGGGDSLQDSQVGTEEQPIVATGLAASEPAIISSEQTDKIQQENGKTDVAVLLQQKMQEVKSTLKDVPQNAKEFLNEKKVEAWESAQTLAQDALKTLSEKLSKVDKRAAFGAVWFGLHALVYPTAIALKAEQFVPEAGNLMQGIRQVIETMPTGSVEVTLAVSAIYGGLAALCAKAMVREPASEDMRTQKAVT